MSMGLIDWLIVLVPTAVVVLIGWRTQRYARSVADFLAGGRVADRFLLAVSDGVAATGLISAVALFEFYYNSGLAVGFWQALQTPVTLLITISGFVVYRFRQTRALTLAQFFEMRYSRRFRIFAGMLAAVSGIVNYGLFPAVGGHFFVYFCGWPATLSILGLAVPTYAILMAVFLAVAVTLVLLGGQVTVMVTDAVQGMFSYVLYLVIAALLLSTFSWGQISQTLLARPVGESFINPFDTFKLADFNIAYVIIGILLSVYSVMAWQGNSGYRAAASSAHEARMGGILGMWRTGVVGAMFALMALCAYTYLHHHDFAGGAVAVGAKLDQIGNDAVRSQMTVPLALAHILPPGGRGVLAALMLFLMVTTDTTYIHSWGGIVVQDIILPLRRRPMTPRQHMLALRLSMIGVALFAFFFSLLFKQTTYILMFFALTGSIYLGGAGSVIIGGLYWRRGTTAGAWAALVIGSIVGLCGFVFEQKWAQLLAVMEQLFGPGGWYSHSPDKFPINGQWMWLISMLTAISVYVIVSAVTYRGQFNLDQMLHRGKYRRDDVELPPPPPRSLRGLIGLGPEFSRSDKVIAVSVFCWIMGLFGVWLTATLWNLVPTWRWSAQGWANYFWIIGILVPLAVTVFTSVWFTWGGVRDLRRLFSRLAAEKPNELDDGRVVGHMNADDPQAQALLHQSQAAPQTQVVTSAKADRF